MSFHESFQQDDFWDEELGGLANAFFYQDFVAQGYGILTLNPKKAPMVSWTPRKTRGPVTV